MTDLEHKALKAKLKLADDIISNLERINSHLESDAGKVFVKYFSNRLYEGDWEKNPLTEDDFHEIRVFIAHLYQGRLGDTNRIIADYEKENKIKKEIYNSL